MFHSFGQEMSSQYPLCALSREQKDEQDTFPTFKDLSQIFFLCINGTILYILFILSISNFDEFVAAIKIHLRTLCIIFCVLVGSLFYFI